MEVVTRRRLLAAITVATYALAIGLLGLAAGFDHGAIRWLLVGGITGLAVGTGASAGMRLRLFVLDPHSRDWWWTKASWPTRALRTLSLGIRTVGVVIILNVALAILRS